MKHWRYVLALAGIIGLSFVAWAGQVPNPINADNTITAGHFILGNGPQRGQDSGWSLVPMANGGCNAALTATNNDLLYSTAAACALLATANNSILATNGSGAPAWTTSLPGGITIPAGDLPLPTASTLGALESISCPAHQWIDVIPTTQVQPTCAQPAITDISGITATAPVTYTSGTWAINLDANFAVVSNNLAFANCNAGYVHGNASGSPAEPVCSSLSAMLDQAFSNAQGDILYRDASLWKVLAPGTNLQMLETQGASANPVWASVRQNFTTSTSATLATNATNYWPLSGWTGSTNTETQVNQLFSYGGTFRNLYCQLGTAPGTGNTWTVTLRVNGASPVSGPTLTVSNTATTGNDTTHTATITVGQTADFQYTTSASNTAAKPTCSIEFDAP